MVSETGRSWGLQCYPALFGWWDNNSYRIRFLALFFECFHLWIIGSWSFLRFCLAAPNGSGLHEVAEDLCAETGSASSASLKIVKLSKISRRMRFFFPRSVMESLQDQESSLPVKRRRLQGLKARSTPFSKGKIQSQKQGIPSNPSFFALHFGDPWFWESPMALWRMPTC